MVFSSNLCRSTFQNLYTYQRVSPDVLPLSNGRKPTLRTCKEDDSSDGGGAARIPAPYSSPFDAKPLRPRSGSASANPSPDNHHHHHFPHFSLSPDPVPSPPAQTATAVTVTAASSPAAKPQTGLDVSNGRCAADRGGGDVILQWGHNKRSRGSRAESRGAAAAAAAAAGDESSTVHPRQMIKIQRRAAIIGAERMAAAAMPPPPSATTSYVRGASLRPVMPLRDSTGSLHSRTVEDRSGGHSRSDKRSPPSPPDKPHHASRTAPNGCGSDAGAASANPESKPPSDRDTAGTSGGGASTATEKVNLEHFEWPRIYISLSRKEKEDDFLAMKGTKLPQRPKKRAKNIDKALQYCFPGMWLSDLTRGRYEVREKKCVKKKRRGLKGMESMDSDSE